VLGRRKNADELRSELQEVEALISAHPLASQRIRAAHQLVDNRESGDAADIDQQLADQGLPSVEELGRVQVAGSWSWWKLHRRRRKLERKIERRAGA
jgi:hypothetical protein